MLRIPCQCQSYRRVPYFLRKLSSKSSPLLKIRTSTSLGSSKLSPSRNLQSELQFTSRSNQQRTFLTSATSLASTSSSSSHVVEKLPSEGFSFLEYMDQNSTFSASSGTIFSDTAPVIYFSDLLCVLKDFDGLSWIQVILCSTVVIRLAIGLPIAITQQRSIGRLESLTPEIKQLAQELSRETGYAIKKFGWDEKTAKRQYKKSFKKHWRKLLEEHNCHPMRTLCLALLQVPVWICFSSALRNVVFGLPLPRTEESAMRWFEMHQEGLPWVSSLTVNDPIVLPLIFLVSNIMNIWIHRGRNKNPVVPLTTLQKSLPWVFTGGIICISGFACFVPSAVTLYWATSSTVALAQNVVLLHPGLRRRLKMPMPIDTKSNPPQPA